MMADLHLLSGSMIELFTPLILRDRTIIDRLPSSIHWKKEWLGVYHV